MAQVELDTVDDNWEMILGDSMTLEGFDYRGPYDHVITDPPYEAEARAAGRRIKRSGKLDHDPLPFEQITEEIRERVANIALNTCNGWAIVFCEAEAIAAWRNAFGFKAWRRSMVWIKPDGPPQITGDRPAMGYESIATAWCGAGKSRWNGGRKHGVYTCTKDRFEAGKAPHPTTKPIALMEALIRDFTQPGDLICDPFAGSGSTGVAAIRLGRRFIGWEKNEDFFAKAVGRLRAARPQGDLFYREISKAKPLKLQGIET